MADNLGYTPGSGSTIATDDAGAGGHVQIIKLAISADGSATVIPADATYGLDVDVTRIASVTPGTGATDLGKAEDAAHSSGDTGVMALAVRKDTAAASSGTTGDYEPLSTDATGRLRTVSTILDEAGDAVSMSPMLTTSVTPTLDTSAYVAGDVMDGVQEFTSATKTAGSGHIVRVTVNDKDDLGASGDFTLHFFEASVTAASDNAAHSLSDADADQYIGSVSTTSGTWMDHTNNQTVTVLPVPPIPFKVDSGTSLYAIPVAIDGATRTASGLTIKLQILPD